MDNLRPTNAPPAQVLMQTIVLGSTLCLSCAHCLFHWRSSKRLLGRSGSNGAVTRQFTAGILQR